MAKASRKLHNHEITLVAARVLCKPDTVRKYFKAPKKMRASTKARIEAVLVELGFAGENQVRR